MRYIQGHCIVHSFKLHKHTQYSLHFYPYFLIFFFFFFTQNCVLLRVLTEYGIIIDLRGEGNVIW